MDVELGVSWKSSCGISIGLVVGLGFVDERHIGITLIFGHSYLNSQRAGTCPESFVLPFGCSQHCTYLNEGQRKYAITMVSAYLNIPSIRECRLGTRRYKKCLLENHMFNIYFWFSKAIVGFCHGLGLAARDRNGRFEFRWSSQLCL